MERWELIQFRISPQLKNKIKEYCDKHDISISSFLRMAIDRAVTQDSSISDTLDKIEFDSKTLETERQFYSQEKSDVGILKKDIKEMKAVIRSIVDYIKQKELKQMHKDLHPRENK